MIRRSVLAGAWYPSSAEQCLTTFARYADQIRRPKQVRAARGGIVPHAGWTFSGAIAYAVLDELRRHASAQPTLVLFGGHLAGGAAPTVMAEGVYETPLGTIPSDAQLARLLGERFAELRIEDPADHDQDNAIEVQLPMIKHLFGEASLLAIGAPPDERSVALAKALVDVAAGLDRDLVIIGSTDLTHYGPNYGWAPKGLGPDAERWVEQENDRRLIEATLTMQPQRVLEDARAYRSACCSGAAAAAIEGVRCLTGGHDSRAELLRYATSAHVHRSSSFVGYAGIVMQ